MDDIFCKKDKIFLSKIKSFGEYNSFFCTSTILNDIFAILNKLVYFSIWEVGKPHFTTIEFKLVSFKLNFVEISFASSSRKI